MAARVIGIGDSTPKKKKALTEAGYAQGRPAIAGSRQGIEPDVSFDQGRSEEAGYSQGSAGEISSQRQEIEPDGSSNQGKVLDNTNVDSDQLQRGIMTRELFAKTGHDGHG
jgi:hypothetical protein